MKCQGACEHRGTEHKGEVEKVLVSGGLPPFDDPMEFYYCQTAIDDDRRDGFTVEVQEED